MISVGNVRDGVRWTKKMTELYTDMYTDRIRATKLASNRQIFKEVCG